MPFDCSFHLNDFEMLVVTPSWPQAIPFSLSGGLIARLLICIKLTVIDTDRNLKGTCNKSSGNQFHSAETEAIERKSFLYLNIGMSINWVVFGINVDSAMNQYEPNIFTNRDFWKLLRSEALGTSQWKISQLHPSIDRFHEFLIRSKHLNWKFY